MSEQERGAGIRADEVQGHGFRGNVMDDPAQDQAGAPGFSSGSLGAEDDVEGHGLRAGVVDAEPASGDDDVEGHGFRGN